MRDYIQLLLWILFLYFWSWFYTGWRTESALITVNRKFSKVFFYIKSFHEISVVSIIMGLFAHFSLIFFLVLVCANHAVAPYMSLIVKIWIWLGISLGAVGETIETYIKMKRAEAVSKKREFLILTILLAFVTGFMICMMVKCSLLVNTIQRETESENHRAAVWNNTRIDVMNEIVDIEAVDINLEMEKVVIVEDKEVRDNNTFVSFINKEIAAYDSEEKAYQYIYEYFSDYGEIFGIHYMAEDLNQDGRKELLVFIQKNGGGFGDLLVFEEGKSGELIAWEAWDNIMTDRQPYVYYCGKGMFEMYGGRGISIGHYTQEKTPELLMDWCYKIEEYYDTYYEVNQWLRIYENGKEIKNMEYKCYYDTATDEHISKFETEEAREGERLAEELMATLEEEKAIPVDNEENRDKVNIVSLEKLKNP